MKRLLLTLSCCALSAACTTELPRIDPGQFACVDDEPFDGNFPCDGADYCFEGACTPRLSCNLETGTPGCAGPADPSLGVPDPNATRCEVAANEQTVSMQCTPGFHTVTSTRPRDFASCDCAVDPERPEEESLLCAALAGDPVNGGYPLYILPEGGELPNAALGVPAEIVEARMCVRACSTDANCPASHTCRPAAVVDAGLLADPTDIRRVIAVCYPNILTPTSSTAEAYQPDPLACAKPQDCGEDNGPDTCSLRLEDTLDHPYSPLGEAWQNQRGFVGRCVNKSGLVGAGIGCTPTTANCESGICFGGIGGSRCAQICDPLDPPPGCGVCRARTGRRVLPTGDFLDLVHLCEQ